MHSRFADLGAHLNPGDLLVVNNSATLPAAVDGTRAGRPIAVHFSTALADHVWVVELRPASNATGPQPDVRPGERVGLPSGAALVVLASYPEPAITGSRLWVSRLAIEGDVPSYLARHGRPIRYAYVPQQWPLSSYQTVFARQPGSAEMASAAGPFGAELVTCARIIPVSPSRRSPCTPACPPQSRVSHQAAEPLDVAPTTARLVNLTPRSGGRVIAVGTTVTRALASAATVDGRVRPSHGWTDLVLGPDNPGPGCRRPRRGLA